MQITSGGGNGVVYYSVQLENGNTVVYSYYGGEMHQTVYENMVRNEDK